MDRYAVIGNPIEHSLSPEIHTAFAKQTGEALTYEKILSPVDDFEKTINELRRNNGKGASVTLPFKLAAFNLADEHSDLAATAQAANTLVFRDDDSIYADNTDGTGLIQDITHNHHYCLRQKRILIIGAGGATQNIMGALLNQAPSSITLANRTPEKAARIAEQFSLHGNVKGCGLDTINEGPYDVMINASSAGLTGNFPDLPLSLIGEHSFCYDLVFNKNTTAFLQWAKPANPEHSIDGLGMLVEQAAAAFYLWRGVYPDTQAVIKNLQKRLF